MKLLVLLLLVSYVYAGCDNCIPNYLDCVRGQTLVSNKCLCLMQLSACQRMFDCYDDITNEWITTRCDTFKCDFCSVPYNECVYNLIDCTRGQFTNIFFCKCFNMYRTCLFRTNSNDTVNIGQHYLQTGVCH